MRNWLGTATIRTTPSVEIYGIAIVEAEPQLREAHKHIIMFYGPVVLSSFVPPQDEFFSAWRSPAEKAKLNRVARSGRFRRHYSVPG